MYSLTLTSSTYSGLKACSIVEGLSPRRASSRGCPTMLNGTEILSQLSVSAEMDTLFAILTN